MIFETLVRQALADPRRSQLALPNFPGTDVQALGRPPQDVSLPPNAFLHAGAAEMPMLSIPPSARGMVLSATTAPGDNGLAGQMLTFAPISFIAIRRGAGG